MVRKGIENIEINRTVNALNKLGKTKKIWKRSAELLSKPTKSRISINISKLNKLYKEDMVLIVPGKVLGSGIIEKKISVVAMYYSESAMKKIIAMKGNAYTFDDIIKGNVDKGKYILVR